MAVPDPWGAELQDYRVQLGDLTAAAIPTHITLMPPIDVDDVLFPWFDKAHGRWPEGRTDSARIVGPVLGPPVERESFH